MERRSSYQSAGSSPPPTGRLQELMSTPAAADATDVKAQKGALVRELGTIDATMIVVGSMIGSGIFITSAESAGYVGAPGWLLAAWAIWRA